MMNMDTYYFFAVSQSHRLGRLLFSTGSRCDRNLTNIYHFHLNIFPYFSSSSFHIYLSFHYKYSNRLSRTGGHDLTNIMLKVTSIQVMLLQLTISFIIVTIVIVDFISFLYVYFILYFTLKYDKSRSIDSRSFNARQSIPNCRNSIH